MDRVTRLKQRMDGMTRSAPRVARAMRLALRVIVVGVIAAGAWYALRGVSLALLAHALGRADLPLLVAIGLPLLAVTYVVRTARYAALLPRTERPASFSALWAGVVLSAAGNSVLPLRAGELVRTRETLACGYALRDVAIAQVTEKVVEAITMALCVAPVLLARAGTAATAAGVVAAAIAVGLLTPWALRRLRVAPGQLARCAAWALLGDGLEIALVALCVAALGLPVSLFACIAVYAGVNLAIALPSTPGQVGAFEAGAALPLIALGVERDAAIAFALVYRAIQWVPLTGAGAVLWAHRVLSARPHAQPRVEGT